MEHNHNSKYSPGVLSLLPIFYVGWSDSVLSPSEMEMIHTKINEIDFLTKEEKQLLVSWADPKNPPSQELFKEWVAVIKENACCVDDHFKQNLVDLGIEMAKHGAQHSDASSWFEDKSKIALEEIEVALGIHNSESSNLILKQLDSSDKIIGKHTVNFDIKKMKSILDDEYEEDKDRYRAFFRDPKFKLEIIRDKEDYRAKVLEWFGYIADQGFGLISYPEAVGGENSLGKFASFFEIMAYHDLSLTIKTGVQVGLFGGAILNLGSERHHSKYLNEAGRGKLLGCFAMTETGHGSNVRALETTAIYNHETGNININSPSYHAGKEYIGNALHGKMAAVFCQLIVKEENHGIHCVLVPYRDLEGNVLDGIKVEDCGYKLGLNGVDNGRIWFNNVEVPKENLLNRFGDIDDQGNYHSQIENPAKRFFT
ncbi:MAG: acyl-CoA dehydrogenase family protein, partial [Bacteroidota bacterium]